VSATRTVLLIAEREVRQRLRGRLFVITTIVISVLLATAAAVPLLLGVFDFGGDDDEPAGPPEPIAIAIAGELSPAETEALEQALGPLDLQTVAGPDEATSLVTAEEVQFAIIGGERILVPPRSGVFGFDPPAASRAAETLALVELLAEDGAEGRVGAVLDAAPLPVQPIGDQDPGDAAARLVVANLGVVFLFGVLIMYASMIINGVIEEKGSRVVELLVEAVPVRQLMAGKVLGLGLVGLGQTLVLFAPSVIVLVTTAGDVIPPGIAPLAGLLVLWFVLGYGLYAVIAAGLGSLVSRPEEAQAVLTPANILMILGYFVGFAAINAPDATFARVAALVPFSAPYVMLVRQTLGTPALWEVLLSIGLTLLTIVAMTLLAARLYEGGILRVGARVRLRDAWGAAKR
jgi:ABC-2 type transport system permease protein